MHQLHVGTEQPGPLQFCDWASARRVHSDWQAERAGSVLVALDLLNRQHAAGRRGRQADAVAALA
jgi:hypothetical protein